MIDIENKSMSYSAYRSMIDELLSKNKTTGENHSESMIDYTKMNVHRMNKWDKTVEINKELVEEISNLEKKVKILTFTEAWCGDAAHIVPIIEKLNQSSENFSHEVLLRDENEEVFSNYLFNGTKSIPISVFIDESTGKELTTWGPRPKPAQKMVEENKVTKEYSPDELKKNLQLWYAKDKSSTIQNELVDVIKKIS